jgi:sigma-B regulation protein RsbU (phosphoserine phosphatase)
VVDALDERFDEKAGPLRGGPSTSGGGEIEEAFALLAEMTRSFAESMDLEETLARALKSIAGHLNAEAGSLWLLDSEQSELECRASVGPNSISGMVLPVSKGIIGRSVRENTCQFVFDAQADAAFSSKADQESGTITRSLLCAPMSFSNQKIGAIEVINRRGGNGCFAQEDVYPLQVLASSAALAIANNRMAASLVDAERARHELELAAEIQRNLLPTPQPDPFPIQGLNIPARIVSGDFYDFLQCKDGRLAFCLGDVSGKGIHAAMLMAKTASLYRCLAKEIASPAEILSHLNREICETVTRGMFVTMAAGAYDPETGAVCIANAGHEPVVCHSEGRFSTFEAEAPPLGIVPDGTFSEVELNLRGGSLYIFSDGLTEAETTSGNQLERAGFEKMVQEYCDAPMEERISAIVECVRQLELRDDLTLLGVTDEARRR